MDSISLGYFVDYILTSGTGRTTAVRQLREGRDERFSDFYKPVREAIITTHENGPGPELNPMEQLLMGLQDPREKLIFPKVVEGYRKFLRSGRITWFEPPLRDWPLGGFAVRVAPELGLLLDGRPHAIKLYLRGDPVSPQRLLVTNTILSDALSTTWPGVVFATLDVRRGRLYPHRPKAEISHLIRAEAASFASLYASFDDHSGTRSA